MSDEVGVLAGSSRGAWTGAMNFSPCTVKKFSMSYTPTAGGIKPGLGFWLSAEGAFSPKEVTPFRVTLKGADVSGSADLSPFAPGVVPMTLFISEGGARVEMAGHTFKGFVIGTLAEEPSKLRSRQDARKNGGRVAVPESSESRSGMSPAARRRIGFAVGAVLAYVFGGPVGLFAACLLVFVVRLWNLGASR